MGATLDLSLLETRLRTAGISAGGAAQCLAGRPVTLLADRQRLTLLAQRGLDLTTEEKTSAISLILPAMQSARVPPRRSGSSAQAGAVGGLAAEQGTSAIALLLPAVQAAREAAQRSSGAAPSGADALRGAGFSAQGAVDLLAGRPLTEPTDRALLAILVVGAISS